MPWRELALEPLVCARGLGVFPQVVAERQRVPLLGASRPNQVDVMRVRPRRGTVEEGAEGIVRMRHVDDGIILYSVGRDRKDDGGPPWNEKEHEGDIVFRLR